MSSFEIATQENTNRLAKETESIMTFVNVKSYIVQARTVSISTK